MVGDSRSLRLPDWLILGAPKAGTTALADWLRQHPDAFVSTKKELGFFDEHFDRGLDWYASHFVEAAASQRAGEATPAYLYFDSALDRIAEVVPDVRLAVILREPAARVWSHLWFFRALGVERREPVAVLEHELADPSATIDGFPFGYLDVSRYVDRLQAVADRFDRDQLLVLFTEHLRHEPDRAYASLCGHFGLRTVPAPATSANVGGAPRSLAVQRLLGALGSALPDSRTKRRTLRRLVRANTHDRYPSMPTELEQRVRAALAHDNLRLAEWLGHELPPGWTMASR